MKQLKIQIKEYKKNESVFHFYENWNDKLFTFENNEFIVYKKSFINSFFMNYPNIDDRISLFMMMDNINKKRILVIQMKETKQTKINQLIQSKKFNQKNPSKQQQSFDKYLVKKKQKKK